MNNNANGTGNVNNNMNNMNNNMNNNFNNNPVPKPKKPIYKKWWFWVIIGVVLIFFIGVASSSNSDNEMSENNPTNENQKIETKTDAAKVEKPKKEKNKYTVGETASYGGIKYKFKKAVVSQGQDFSQPAKGKEYVICVFKIANKSEDKIDVNMFDFKAYCDDNAVDEAITDGNLDLVEKYGSLSVSDLEPGKKKTGCLTYEVPKGWKKLEINTKIDAGLFDSKDVKFVVKNK